MLKGERHGQGLEEGVKHGLSIFVLTHVEEKELEGSSMW